ncbi:MAG: TrkH family potassium uptake protein [Egibacteraceae bacterium]
MRIIGLYTGRILTGLGVTMLVPASLGAARGEVDDALGFVIAAALAVLVGQTAEWRLHIRRDMQWSHAMAVVALAWLAAAFVGAIPLFLSGHYASFLDAYFDAMSGFATAGLAVINDLDHLSDSVNLWRHLMHFLGGQGLVLVALSMFAGGGGLTGLYVGEGREERVLPNVVHSARFIWRVALFYGVVGTSLLWAALLVAGMPLGTGLFHAVTLFMAAFDTGGFAPTSANLAFYHSGWVEAAAAVLMVAGSLSFAVHHHLWDRRPWEIVRNVETRTLALTMTGLSAVAMVGLARSGTFDSAEMLFRRGFFQILSAHSGTGFNTVPGQLFETDWGTLAPGMLVIAMALGGMAGSTSGGIKALRVALLYKSVRADLRRMLLPRNAVVVEHYYATGGNRIVSNELARSAAMVLLLYIGLYLTGAVTGLFYGYSLQEALFESTSAAAAVGLSVGLVRPEMETGLKIVYILQMWVGRLEFVSVFALFGYLYSTVRGKT